MEIEFEATFPEIDKDDIRKRLKSVGARLIRPEFQQRRVTFNLPPGIGSENCWLRVRDEGERITVSLKEVNGSKIADQKEICLIVDDFDKAVRLLVLAGCQKKSYQETKREIWNMNEVEICLDEWPYLEPFAELEADSEEKVRNVSDLLGLDYSKALFGPVSILYSNKYGVPENIINNSIPEITFDGENPFLKL